MKYPGNELELFDKAKVWRKYIYFKTKKYFKGKFLEIGAGIGSFTRNYESNFSEIIISDLDEKNNKILNEKFENFKNIKITNKKINEIQETFDTIIYLNVLEHIEKDKEEIMEAEKKLNPGGHLIILVPAHQKLYSKFDEAIGHFRRYDINFFKKNKFQNLKLAKLIYLDFFGYLLYYLNNFFFKKDVYPSPIKIYLWDKIFTPFTILIDFLIGYSSGKNILCVYKKGEDL
tara:strand:+ start:13367 stop:14059 length:693 start_codon:yes stop_codon:yes gene_type:complete